MEREPREKRNTNRQQERDARLPIESRIRRTLAAYDEKDPTKKTLKYQNYRAVAASVFEDTISKLKRDEREKALDIYEGQVWYVARKAVTDIAHPGHRTESNVLLTRDRIAIRKIYGADQTQEELIAMFTRPRPDSYKADNENVSSEGSYAESGRFQDYSSRSTEDFGSGGKPKTLTLLDHDRRLTEL